MSFGMVVKEVLIADILDLASNVSNVLTQGILEQCDPGMLRRILRSLSDIYEEIHS